MDEEKRILFFVPYHEREDAKRLGAKWDSKAKKWWVDASALLGFGVPLSESTMEKLGLGKGQQLKGESHGD